MKSPWCEGFGSVVRGEPASANVPHATVGTQHIVVEHHEAPDTIPPDKTKQPIFVVESVQGDPVKQRVAEGYQF